MSNEQVKAAVDEIRNDTAALYEALKKQTEKQKAELEAGYKSEHTILLEKINKSLDAAEDAKQAAEQAQSMAKAVASASVELKETRADMKRYGLEKAEDVAYRSTFLKFMRKGEERLSNDEFELLKSGPSYVKDLTGQTNPDGGYVIMPDLDVAITRVINETSPIRQIATVKTISSDQYEKSQRVDRAGAEWLDRLAGPSVSTTPTYRHIVIRAHDLGAKPRIHQKMLDDAFVDIENELMMAVALEFELAENTAFCTGTGVGMPFGFLNYGAGSSWDSATIASNWGSIEQVAGTDASLVKYEGLVNVQNALKDGYLQGAVWLMRRSTRGAVRNLKNGVGDPLWAPGLSGEPSTLMGHSIYTAADMPAVGANALAIAFGNFAQGYSVVDRIGTRLLRDPYSSKPYVEYFTTKRVGGAADNTEAIKLMKIST